MRPDVPPADQAQGLRRAFARHGLTVMPVCTAGRDAASRGWVVNVAAALAERGRRVLVLDGDRGLVAPALGLKARLELRHLLGGECDFADAVLAAGENLAVLPGARGLEMFTESGEEPATLFGAFLALDPPVDFLVVTGPVERVAPLVAAEEEVVFVASPARESLVGAYAAIKRMEQAFPGRVARIALTGPADEGQTRDVALRLADATRRFLGHQPAFADPVCDHPDLAEAARVARSVLAVAPDGPAAAEFRRVADGIEHWRLAFHDSSREG